LRGANTVTIAEVTKKLNKGYYSNPDASYLKIVIPTAVTPNSVFILIDYEIVKLEDLAYIYQNLPIEF